MSLQHSIQPRSIQPRISELTDSILQRCHAACRQYGGVLAALVALQIVVYSYFFTTVILTDHTFPNTWVQPYPSHRTRDEGRWLQDLIIFFQGEQLENRVRRICDGLANVLSILMACNTVVMSF